MYADYFDSVSADYFGSVHADYFGSVHTDYFGSGTVVCRPFWVCVCGLFWFCACRLFRFCGCRLFWFCVYFGSVHTDYLGSVHADSFDSVSADYFDHPCVRTCEDQADPMECRYRFVVESYQSMSKACYDCAAGNISDCNRDHCVTVNGFSRNIKTVNRGVPGPTIQVRACPPPPNSNLQYIYTHASKTENFIQSLS